MSDSPNAGESVAIFTRQSSLTHHQLESAAVRGAQHLSECGIVPGNTVAVALGQTVETVVLIRALMRLGAAACMINPAWPQKEIGRALAAAQCTCIIDQFTMTQDGAGSSSPQIDPDAPATVIFTSGSTGDPKPAVHSVDNHVQSARAANTNIPLQPGDRWLLSLPLHHVAGIAILIRCAAAGAAVAVPGAGMPLSAAIEMLRPTHLSLVPTQLRRLLQDNIRALDGVKAILMGGAPMPRDLVARAFDLGLPIHTSYGLTETSSQVTATRPGATLDDLLTSGTPLTEGTVAISEEGEILVRGRTLFLGYREGRQLHRPMTPEGWFATGDLGRFDAAGRLIVNGRRDNMFISGGENVQPEEVERRLCDLEGVEQALVVPVPDEDYGEVGAAYIKMAHGAAPNAARLAAQLRDQLPPCKIPKHFHPWPHNLPDSATKLSRRITLTKLSS